MKFTINQRELNKGLSIVQRAIVSRTTIPELEGVLIEASDNRIKLTGTDSEIISIETYLDCNVEDDGTTLVNARLFGDIIRKLPDADVLIEIKNDKMDIKCLNSHFELMMMDPEEYPAITRLKDDMSIKIPGTLLNNAIKQTSFAVSQDLNRRTLTGVNFEISENKITFVSLDGYRLSVLTEEVISDINTNAIVPGRALNELSRIAEDDDEITITISDNNIRFQMEGTNFYSQLIEGEYFNYRDIIRDNHATTVTLDKDQFQRSLERAGLLAQQEKSNLIKLEIQDGIVKILSNTELGSVEEQVSATIDGMDQVIAFNSRYLLEGIRNMEDQNIELFLQDDVNPMIIEGVDNDNYLYLVLPVRIA